MDIATIEAEERGLVFQHFDEIVALRLGQALVDLALAGNLPVAIDIRSQNRTYFHASLPGASPNNDSWARRKGNVALMFGTSSLVQRLKHEEKGQTLARSGLADADYALSGGAVLIRAKGAGIVAVATVSGLPDVEDHALVVRAIKGLAATA